MGNAARRLAALALLTCGLGCWSDHTGDALEPLPAGPDAHVAGDAGSANDPPGTPLVEMNDCDAIRSATHCATLGARGIVLLDVDTGRQCLVPTQPRDPARDVSGMPFAMAWLGDDIYACFGGSTGVLQRISLRDGTIEASERACDSVVQWQGGLLVQNLLDGVGLFEGTSAFSAEAEPIEEHSLYMAVSASHDDLLFGWIDGPRVDDQPVRPLLSASFGGTVSDPIQLEGLPDLLTEELYVSGLDLTPDDRIVITHAGTQRGVSVYELASGRRLAFYSAAPDWDVSGLVCAP